MKKNLTIREINERLKKGEAVVMTSSDFKEEVRRGHRFTVGEVDVVTCATRSVMSGTAAMFVVPVAGPGSSPGRRRSGSTEFRECQDPLPMSDSGWWMC